MEVGQIETISSVKIVPAVQCDRSSVAGEPNASAPSFGSHGTVTHDAWARSILSRGMRSPGGKRVCRLRDLLNTARKATRLEIGNRMGYNRCVETPAVNGAVPSGKPVCGGFGFLGPERSPHAEETRRSRSATESRFLRWAKERRGRPENRPHRGVFERSRSNDSAPSDLSSGRVFSRDGAYLARPADSCIRRSGRGP